jgi:hypothetical protein
MISYACLIVFRGNRSGGADQPKVNPCCILLFISVVTGQGNLISDIAYRDDERQVHCIRFVRSFSPDSDMLLQKPENLKREDARPL